MPDIYFEISFPRENETIKHDLVEFKVQCLKVFCYHGNKSTILLCYSIFRTTAEVSSKLYFVEICKVSEKLWLFNHKKADFWLPKFGFKSSLLSLLNPIRSRLFCYLKVQGEVFRDPPKISGTIKRIPMKRCTVIVLLKVYQYTWRNLQKSDLSCHNNVITKNNGKSWTSAKPDKLYINRNEITRASK